MSEPSHTAGVRANASAGHLSVHVEGQHPVDIPFMFEQPAKRIAPAALASLISHVFIVIAVVLFEGTKPVPGRQKVLPAIQAVTSACAWAGGRL